MSTVSNNGVAATADLVQRLAEFPTAALSDAQRGLGTLRPVIRSMVAGAKLVGPAHTVKCYPGSIITVHKALLEAKNKGITPFALTVDKEGHDYLGAMCGDIAYEVLGDIEQMPSRLPALYRRLTV